MKKQAAEWGLGCDGMLAPCQWGAGISQDLLPPAVLWQAAGGRSVFVRSPERAAHVRVNSSDVKPLAWPWSDRQGGKDLRIRVSLRAQDAARRLSFQSSFIRRRAVPSLCRCSHVPGVLAV